MAYTSDVDFDAVLVDGNLVHVRPPVNADRAPLLDLHHGLSERSAYFRYFSLSRHAGEAHVDHLLAADTDILSSLIALIGDDVWACRAMSGAAAGVCTTSWSWRRGSPSWEPSGERGTPTRRAS